MTFKCFKVFLFLLFFAFDTSSKETITITADIFEGSSVDEKNNKSTEVFKDNVRITTNGIIITSKSAKRELKNNKDFFEIYDTVKIEKPDENITITAEKIDIISDKDEINISKNIYCNHDDIVFTSEACEYNPKTNIAKYTTGGKFIKSSGNITITSTKGEANLKTSDFVLSDSVEVLTEDFLMHCDKIEYKKSEDILTATGNIKIDMKKRKNEFITTPEEIIYNHKGKTMIAKKALYHSPSYLLAANTLLYDQEHEQLFLSEGFEMIFKNRLRFTCDNATYDIKKRHGDIYGNTVLYDMTSTEQKFLYLSADKFSFDITTYKDHEDSTVPDELDLMKIDDSFTTEEINDSPMTDQQEIPLPQENTENENTKNGKTLSEHNNTKEIKAVEGNKDTIVVEGQGNVQFCSNSLQARSETIQFVNNKIILPKKSIIWNDTNMIIGNDITMLLTDGHISKFKILKDPLFVNADNTGFYNQVSANMMIANIKDNNISKALFKTNVDTYYFVVREDKLTGVNRLQCSKFLLLFNKEKLKTIYFNDKIYGDFYFPDYASKNKTKLLLERFLAEGEFIKNTTAPDVKEIKDKVKTVSLLSDKDIEKFFKEEQNQNIS